MINNIFKGRVFISDLIITMFWALCAATSTPDIEAWMLVVVLSRIVLCLLMRDNSRWAGYLAVVFASAYFMTPDYFYCGGFQHAATQIVTPVYQGIVGDAVAHREYMHHLFDFNVWFYTVWVILTLWLVGLPLIVSMRMRLFGFPKIFWLNISVLIFTSAMQMVLNAGWSSRSLFECWIIITCCLPEICWILRYFRNRYLAGSV